MFIVRCQEALKYPKSYDSIYLSFELATKQALAVAHGRNVPYSVDVYEETYDHAQMKYAITYEMSDHYDAFTPKTTEGF